MTEKVNGKPDGKGTDTANAGVSDDALSTAWNEIDKGEQAKTDGKTEGQTITATKTQEQLEQEEEQRERTRLGRRLKKMEEMITEDRKKLDDRFQNLEDMLSRIGQPGYQNERNTPNVDSTEIPEVITTPDELEKYLEFREKRKTEGQKKYEEKYIASLRGNKGKNPDLHDEIMEELLGEKTYENYIKHTGNAEIDALTNYAEAKSAVLAKKLSAGKKTTKPLNLKEEKGSASTNLNVDSTNDTSPETEIELDDASKEYIRMIGMKSDSVKSALSGPTPIHLAGKR